MKEGPDISRIAALIGDPSRASILTALMAGKALTAGELAQEAGVTPATVSGHLAQLRDADLVAQRKQGRHRYYTLKDVAVAEALEGLAGLAAAKGHLRTRTGPRDAQMRKARSCYDHLAGANAVRMFESLAERGFLQVTPDAIGLSPSGAEFVRGLGIDLDALSAAKRPLCRICLDWSERRSHLGGSLGAALLDHVLAEGWARRIGNSRTLEFSPSGTNAFHALFPVQPLSCGPCPTATEPAAQSDAVP